ncbi:MAG TPA: hypothetical protein VNZ86_02565 [Bacteroidia bacterium]|jgi:hypothetical protein|nr:hypothetical protein [Bacteroidia bacterium]
MKLNLFLLLLYISSPALFSQIVSRPSLCDSTKTMEEQFTPENSELFIGLELYLPPVLHHDSGPVLFSKDSTGGDIDNRYYSIISVLKGDAREQLKQLKAVNRCGTRYKDLLKSQWDDLIIHTVFVLREKKTDLSHPTLLYWVVCQSKYPPYCYSNFDAFFPTAYFEKQKQVYLNQEVILLRDKSKWMCIDVSVLGNRDTNSHETSYALYCVLKNEKREQLQLTPSWDPAKRSFMTAQEYDRLEHANRNQKEQLFQAEKDKKEKFEAECTSRFGTRKGSLIAEGKIEPGMTTDMCKTAWGAPWDHSKTTAPGGTKETWSYNWNYTLLFENGALVTIRH